MPRVCARNHDNEYTSSTKKLVIIVIIKHVTQKHGTSDSCSCYVHTDTSPVALGGGSEADGWIGGGRGRGEGGGCPGVSAAAVERCISARMTSTRRSMDRGGRSAALSLVEEEEPADAVVSSCESDVARVDDRDAWG